MQLFDQFYLIPIFIGGLLLFWRISRRRVYEKASKIPGPEGLPLIGSALDFTGSPNAIFNNILSNVVEYKTIVKAWVGPKLMIFLVDPRDIELVLSSDIHIEKSQEYRLFEPWLGNGLLISSGQTWKNHRKIIAPTFHLQVLKNFTPTFNEVSDRACQRIKKLDGKTFDCLVLMCESTMEALLETVMGIPKKSQNRSSLKYAKAVMEMCEILHLRQAKIWLYFDFIFNFTKLAKKQTGLLKTIHDFTNEVIRDKKNDLKAGIKLEFKEEPIAKPTIVEEASFGLKDDLDADEGIDVGEKKRMAFLDLLLENSDVLSDQEIKEQVDTIMFEGHDTTAAASSFFLSVMGVHQEIQEKVYEELRQIFGDSNRPCTFEDTLEMKYLERCLLETLRLYPPVPVIARHITNDLKLVSGDYSIPAGSTVLIATYKMHRSELIYPNPEVFDPDNFLPEHQANRHFYGFIPFSAGPRSCVGRKYAMLKLKILLSTIIRHFRIFSDLTEKEFRLQGDIILKREEGFPIRCEERYRI